jgi:hypothetical protein
MRATCGASAPYGGASNSIWRPTSSNGWSTPPTGCGDGEARQVTVMFTDIEGFTALTERYDARDVLKVLDGYLTIVTDIVIEHGGMVDKLIGDEKWQPVFRKTSCSHRKI